MKIKLNKRNKKKFIIGAISLTVITVVAIVAVALFKANIFKGKEKTNESGNFDNKVNNLDVQEDLPKLNIVDLNSKSRPYAVMINNINIARKYQSGLQDAYIIYELIAEGGITRMLALFKDQETARIGTVRSARHYYLDYVLENDAIYVHWGWSPQAESDISSLGIQNINGLKYGNTYFWKDDAIRKQGVGTEHTAYTSMEKLKTATEKLNYRAETDQDLLFNYSPEEVDLSSLEGAISTTSIDINYSSSTKNHYDYDSETKTYLRSVNGTKHTDYVTKKQYSFKNIIVYQADNVSISGDNKGRQDLKNIGTGEGYFITDGYAVPIKWTKKDRKSQTVYTLNDGTEITLNDGNTFIQIQPKGQTLSIK